MIGVEALNEVRERLPRAGSGNQRRAISLARPRAGLAEVIDTRPDELARDVRKILVRAVVPRPPPLIAGVVLWIARSIQIDLVNVRLAAQQNLMRVLLVVTRIPARLIIHADDVHVVRDFR